MSDIAIRVENLSKRYRIGKVQPPTGRRSLLQKAVAPFRYLASTLSSPSEDEILWALKDISFEVKHGEVLGVIGRNGAGKSTLLKILSRITEPTSGRALINGRVGSLLEVGTGFHPELTGRENIYLNGAILGMQHKEIDRKFDEIVAFSEIEKFLDTPVKRYSSGMYVRLAFAVAAHLEPEILLVDEVLAVGDLGFQKKCLGKMDQVSKSGRAVLFVSHNMQVISGICGAAAWFDQGAIREIGPCEKIINDYVSSNFDNNRETIIDLNSVKNRQGNGKARFIEAFLIGENGTQTTAFQVGEKFQIKFMCLIADLDPNQFYQIRIISSQGIPIYHWVDFDNELSPPTRNGIDIVKVSLEKLLLYPGKYLVSLLVSDRYGTAYDYLENIIDFDVIAGSKIPMKRQYFPSLGIIHEIPTWARLEANENEI
jgi:lipopolysaccharide transport system ATP-binding protein